MCSHQDHSRYSSSTRTHSRQWLRALFPLYIYEKDGQRGYVVPLQGSGLWDDIWGNIALASDFNTVIGVNFDHAGETPGLGAEIATKGFQEPFIGKHIYDANGNFTSVPVSSIPAS